MGHSPVVHMVANAQIFQQAARLDCSTNLNRYDLDFVDLGARGGWHHWAVGSRLVQNAQVSHRPKCSL